MEMVEGLESLFRIDVILSLGKNHVTNYFFPCFVDFFFVDLLVGWVFLVCFCGTHFYFKIFPVSVSFYKHYMFVLLK